MELKIIQSKIFHLRNCKVILDLHLAELCNVEIRILKQAVRRNLNGYPSDFMFELTEEKLQFVILQNVIPSKRHFRGARPFAFTEQIIPMLSNVLNILLSPKSKRIKIGFKTNNND